MAINGKSVCFCAKTACFLARLTYLRHIIPQGLLHSADLSQILGVLGHHVVMQRCRSVGHECVQGQCVGAAAGLERRHEAGPEVTRLSFELAPQ